MMTDIATAPETTPTALGSHINEVNGNKQDIIIEDDDKSKHNKKHPDSTSTPPDLQESSSKPQNSQQNDTIDDTDDKTDAIENNSNNNGNVISKSETDLPKNKEDPKLPTNAVLLTTGAKGNITAEESSGVKVSNKVKGRRPIHPPAFTTTIKFRIPLAIILISAITIYCFPWLNNVNGVAGSRNEESAATSPKMTTTTTTTLVPRISKSQSMSSYFDALKRKYHSQTRSFWANVESTFAHSVLRAKDPSIVMLVSDARTHATADALTNDLFDLCRSLAGEQHGHVPRAELVIDPLEPGGHIERLIRNSDSLDGSDGDRVKLAIDEKLKRIFGTLGAKLALVRNIEHIPAKSMILFYTYGDDLANAKYPGVLILMTLRIGREMSASERDELLKRTASLTHFVERHLIDLWSRAIGDDQLKPLFTRIANNIVLVNAEGDNEQASK